MSKMNENNFFSVLLIPNEIRCDEEKEVLRRDGIGVFDTSHSTDEYFEVGGDSGKTIIR